MKADEAKTGAAESSERVRTALNTVDDILNLLSKSLTSQCHVECAVTLVQLVTWLFNLYLFVTSRRM